MSPLHCTACRRATSWLLSRALFKIAALLLKTSRQEPGRFGGSTAAVRPMREHACQPKGLQALWM